jgi:copper homeostasis protein
MQRELEICVETLQACEAAQQGGADRIELCAALTEGGVTPSLGFLKEALAAVTIPIHALIRPRSGDFVYSDAEFRMLCADVEGALSVGAAGIVVGVLTPDRSIDRARAAELIRLAKGRSVTFHRAFDHAVNLAESLDLLIDLGCNRILTSGGKPNVTEGRESLAALTNQAAGRIRIAAGGGVTLQNASTLTAVPGLDLHASLRPKVVASHVNDALWQPFAGYISEEAVRTLSTTVHAS